jgi:hypothetical protein
VKLYSAHTRPRTPPVLVREGFSWGALFLGPFWLLAHRAWVAGVLALCAGAALLLAPDPLPVVLLPVLAWFLGLSGNDLWRWSLERRGFLLAHVVAGRDSSAAYARLLTARPDLAQDAAA